MFEVQERRIKHAKPFEKRPYSRIEVLAEEREYLRPLPAMPYEIRANQGHSIPVDVELPEVIPPDVLYHGTGVKYKDSIDVQGLIPKSRLYIHLSGDIETARKVGQRHGKPIIYTVDAAAMHADSYVFYRSVNGVWLTKAVPQRYLSCEL